MGKYDDGLRLFAAIKDGAPYDPSNYLHQRAIERGIGVLLGYRIVPTPDAVVKYLSNG